MLFNYPLEAGQKLASHIIEWGLISSPSHTTVRAVRHTAVQLTFNAFTLTLVRIQLHS